MYWEKLRNGDYRKMKKYIKGLVLIIGIAVVSTMISDLLVEFIKIEKLTIGIIIGILYTSTRGLGQEYRPGVQFSLKKLLKWGIVLLGFKLNFLTVLELGPKMVIMVIILISLVLIFARKLGDVMGLNPKLSTLIGVGSSICGASAIVAMSQVIDAEDDDSVLAVSIISFLGAMGVLAFSSLALVLNMSDVSYGVWSGLSLQGVAHAIAAAFARGEVSGEIGTIIKMTRVMMLAPVSVLLSRQFSENNNINKVGIPGYVLLFLGAAIIGTLGIIPQTVIGILTKCSSYFILMAMISMGLIVDLKQIRENGLMAVLHGVLVFVMIVIGSYAMVKIII